MQIPFAFVNKNCTEYKAKLSAAFTSEVIFCYILFPVHESFRTFYARNDGAHTLNATFYLCIIS